MKLSKRIHIQQEPQGETWYTILQALECSIEQAIDIVNKMSEIPVIAPAIPSDKVSMQTVDRANWTVTFTFKAFPSIDEVKVFLKSLPQDLAKVTGQKTLDDVIQN